MQLLTINEASALAGKSIQTIRRMIKQKKVQVKRQKTPQGFNYLVVKESLITYLSQTEQPSIQGISDTHEVSREHQSVSPPFEDRFKTEIDHFNSTIQKLMDQHEKDKTNFFELIKTFQDRATELENRVKLLSSPRPGWWQFWK